MPKWLRRFFSLPASCATYDNSGYLHISSVETQFSEQAYEVTLKLISVQPLRFEVVNITPPLSLNALPDFENPPAPETPVKFRCNICGQFNEAPLALVNNREAPSCNYCHSSLRMRALMQAMSVELFSRTLTLPEFPEDLSITGLGMSDWEGYARILSKKLSYTNTFYHQEPRLDITQILPEQENLYDFIISTDVFEHIPPPVSVAFENAYRLLKPGGLLLFTVPYKKDGDTEEHFPLLYNYRLEEENGQPYLYNITRDGKEQVFRNLVFHGGGGFTLEMRLFSETGLLAELSNAGFTDIKIHHQNLP
jgi:SAM-dependent methyltransferase